MDAAGKSLDEAEVAWREPEVQRPAAEPRLDDAGRRALPDRALVRRHARGDDGCDLGSREEADRGREPVSGRDLATVQEGDDRARRVADRLARGRRGQLGDLDHLDLGIVEVADRIGVRGHDRDERLVAARPRPAVRPGERPLPLVVAENPQPVEDGGRVDERAQTRPSERTPEPVKR